MNKKIDFDLDDLDDLDEWEDEHESETEWKDEERKGKDKAMGSDW